MTTRGTRAIGGLGRFTKNKLTGITIIAITPITTIVIATINVAQIIPAKQNKKN